MVIRWLVGAVCGLAAVVVAAGLVLAAYGLHDRLGPCDVAIVLGNKIELNGRPSKGLAARLDRAVELYHAGLFAHVIVSGARDKQGFDEAAVMADYMVQHGVPASAVIADHLGDNTMATARDSAALMKAAGWRSAMAVTQYYHIARTRLALRAQGLSTVYTAHARLFMPHDVFSLGREEAGYVDYWLRTRARQGA